MTKHKTTLTALLLTPLLLVQAALATPAGADAGAETVRTTATVVVPDSTAWEGADTFAAVAISAEQVEADRLAHEAALEAARRAEIIAQLTAAGARVGETGWVRPVDDGIFTSDYGPRAAIPAIGLPATTHIGIDLAAPFGTPIRAAFDGVVSYVGYGHPELGLSGWVVVIDHDGGVQTSYNHMDDEPPLTVGQAVRAGETITAVGSSGNSTGPHLHLSVWVDGEHVDPVDFFLEQGVELR